MTRKDLNLSLDQSLMQQDDPQTPHRRNVIQLPGGTKSKKRTKKAAPSRHSSIQTKIMAGIAFINMAALLLAAYWLSSLQTTVPDPARAIVGRSELMLMGMDEKITLIQLQLEELQLAALNQEKLALQAIAENTERAEIALTTKNKVDEPVLTKEIPEPADNWYISLGTFSSEEEAVNLQQQLRSIGQQAQISHQARNEKGRASFEVRISGFDNRESAELATGKIMQQTRLNGLGVWKSD